MALLFAIYIFPFENFVISSFATCWWISASHFFFSFFSFFFLQWNWCFFILSTRSIFNVNPIWETKKKLKKKKRKSKFRQHQPISNRNEHRTIPFIIPYITLPFLLFFYKKKKKFTKVFPWKMKSFISRRWKERRKKKYRRMRSPKLIRLLAYRKRTTHIQLTHTKRIGKSKNK